MPVSGSTSCSVATTIADVWSLATIRPIQSDFAVLARTSASCSGEPLKLDGTSTSPLKPSSTTSV